MPQSANGRKAKETDTVANRKPMTYAGVGVNYDLMDPFKRAAQIAGRETAENIRRINHGEFRELERSRGESAYLIETPDFFLAHVEEGLGTKNLVADAMYKLTGKSYYDQIAQDTVAMMVNDMITLGALPLSVAMHLAVGDSDWFSDQHQQRSQDLIDGWKNACNLARCVWGGGETPALTDTFLPDGLVLSGSAIGVIKPKNRLITANVQPGDAIMIFESSGIHANALTLARKIAQKLSPDKDRPELGYLPKLSDGRSYGEALLDPTHIYVPIVEECLNAGVHIHYAVNITGHGWRKLMRAPSNFQYYIDHLPKQLPIFDFIQEHGPVEDREAYGNLNMGAGFAIFVPPTEVMKVVKIHERSESAKRFGVICAGHVKEDKGKSLVIAPKNLVYRGSELGVR